MNGEIPPSGVEVTRSEMDTRRVWRGHFLWAWGALALTLATAALQVWQLTATGGSGAWYAIPLSLYMGFALRGVFASHRPLMVARCPLCSFRACDVDPSRARHDVLMHGVRDHYY